MTTSTASKPNITTDQAFFHQLSERFDDAVAESERSERDKLTVIVEGFLKHHKLGGDDANALANLYTNEGVKSCSDNPFNRVAQLIVGKNVKAMSTKTDEEKRRKKVARNHVDRAAGLMRALQAHGKTSGKADGIVAWVLAFPDGITGVINSVKAASVSDTEPKVIDLAEYREALGQAPLKFKCDAAILDEPTISIHRRDGDDLVMLPLANVPAEVLDTLRAYLPAPDANVSDEIKLLSGVNLACQLFDRTDSGIPLHPDKERHPGEKMAPSLPVVRITGDRAMSVAATRVDAGMVVTVEVEENVAKEIGLRQVAGLHLNGEATRRLAEHLSSARNRGRMKTAAVTTQGAKAWIDVSANSGTGFKLYAYPMSAFGSSAKIQQWTLGVRSTFKPVAEASIIPDDGKLPEALSKFAARASTSKHVASVKVVDGKLSLALGKSNPDSFSFEGQGSGDAVVTIAARDLARVIAFAADLEARAMQVALDPKGMARFSFATPQATYAVHVPAVKDDKVVTLLLDQIERA